MCWAVWCSCNQAIPPRSWELDLRQSPCGGGGQVNNGTYKSGFATSQAAYDRAQQELYAALDALEARLARHRFLVGDRCAIPRPCGAALQSAYSLLLASIRVIFCILTLCSVSQHVLPDVS